MLVGFPSTDFPGPPPFRFDLPEDWKAVPTAEADAMVVGPDEVDGVRPNVVITAHKVRSVEEPAQLLRQMVDGRFDAAGVNDESRPEPLFEDDSRYSVRISRTFVDPDSDAVDVEQWMNLSYLAGPNVSYVLAATGTYSPASTLGKEQVESVVRSVQC